MTGQQEGLASPWYPSFFHSDNSKLAEMKPFCVLIFANVLYGLRDQGARYEPL
jgi:hypothetical protein